MSRALHPGETLVFHRKASLHPEPWAQSLYGRRIDLVNPKVEQVDFREIADTLAGINRYNGGATRPVSVAAHTLYCLLAADAAKYSATLKAMVLLHDAHESRVGDTTTPQAQMRAALTEEMFGPAEAQREREMWREAKRRHDVAIHQAAGLPLPSPAQAELIFDIDMRVLVTERRDFLAPCAEPWDAGLARFLPLPRKLKAIPPAEAAQQLCRAFCTYLPALGSATGRARR